MHVMKIRKKALGLFWTALISEDNSFLFNLLKFRYLKRLLLSILCLMDV